METGSGEEAANRLTLSLLTPLLSIQHIHTMPAPLPTQPGIIHLSDEERKVSPSGPYQRAHTAAAPHC